MSSYGTLSLFDRTFEVRAAEVCLDVDNTWFVEIETECLIFDDERWEPRLYHQGLKLAARTPEQLCGLSTSWRKLTDPDYPHPEYGLLYVFGHHHVYDSTIRFGPLVNDRIALNWTGLCEVFWDERFSEDVLLNCQCEADVHAG